MAESADRDVNQGLRERFTEVYSQYQQLRSGLDELQERLALLRVTERSTDGLVTVVVGSAGQVISVVLDAAVQRERDVNRLSNLITETIHRATKAATAATQSLATAYLPAGVGALDYLGDGKFASLLRRSDAAMDGGGSRDG